MKKITCGLFVFFSGFCLLSGCANSRYYSTPRDDCYLLADYEDTIRQWSAEDEIHSRFLSTANGVALFLSWEVRQGFINAVRDRMNPDPAYLQQLIQRNIHQFDNGNEFYIGLYCYEEKWSSLTGTDPVWYLTLQSDKKISVRPSLVEQIEIRPEQAWMFLDEMTHGKKLFRVVFPITDGEGHALINQDTRVFTIKCSSLLGTMEFKWTLGPVPCDLD